ncbi:unnamed protein product [Thelazia callipaeda]|uniref:BUB1 N-terminal domain-containing protein n=1 Tax=Thelazia callipaeda TaxID=103827 RepID=A0A0N5D9P2_THECL|nr:unnamed protein product [Thelazia callipaeda]
MSKLSRKPTNELERMMRKGDDWSANDLFKFQHGNLDHYDMDEKRAICTEWLRRLQKIPKKFCYLAWYASAMYTCYYRLAPLITDKEEKKRIWIDVKREYAEIFLMGRRIWRRPTHPTRLRILYDLAMLCVRFNDVHNDETVLLFRDLLDDNDNFNFEVLDDIEYAQSIDKTVRLENHVIDLFYQRRKSSCSTRSSFYSKGSTETPRSSFRSLKAKSDEVKSSKLRNGSFLSIPDNMISDSAIITSVITSKSPGVTRRHSVRFAEKSSKKSPSDDDLLCLNEKTTKREETVTEDTIKQQMDDTTVATNVKDLSMINNIETDTATDINSLQTDCLESDEVVKNGKITGITVRSDRHIVIRKDSDHAEAYKTLSDFVICRKKAFISVSPSRKSLEIFDTTKREM